MASGVYPFKLVNRVPLVYPAAARKAHVEGTVALRATIGRNGAVQRLEVIEGPGLLTDAAIAAVKQWVYTPYLVNGEPRAVQTVIQVNFAFSGQANELAQDPRLLELPRIGMATHLRSFVDPTVTSKPHGKGLVSLDVIVSSTGTVEDVIPVHGSAELIAIAQDAVKQWKYEPDIIRGQAAAVATRVTFDFE